MIFDDLHKLLLYQRYNLGFECRTCKRNFHSKLDLLQHTRNCKNEILKCPKCGKMFGHQQILQLHLQFHNLSDSSAPAPVTKTTGCDVITECIEVNDSDDEDKSSSYINTGAMGITHEESVEHQEPSVDVGSDLSKDTHIQFESMIMPPITFFETPKKRPSHNSKAKPKKAKKRVGLTKIRMEDCRRCDACSCIYIDEKDYYKHMRNFHQLDMNNTPIPQQKAKRKCRSCCKQCRGAHCTSVKRPRATQRASNLIFKINMRDNIKDRWTKMVSQQLSECTMPEFIAVSGQEVEVKPDPDAVTIKTEPDLSHLLSQVEVKIKTEPVDDYFI